MSPVGPAVLINHLGKGTVLTFAAAPDAATASVYPVGEVRKLFRNAVRLLHPWPRAKIEAPANVEAVVTDDPAHRTLRVHLIGYNAPPQVPKATDYPNVFPAAMEDAPMYRAAVEIGPPIKGASAYDSSTPLSTTGNRRGSNDPRHPRGVANQVLTWRCVAISRPRHRDGGGGKGEWVRVT